MFLCHTTAHTNYMNYLMVKMAGKFCFDTAHRVEKWLISIWKSDVCVVFGLIYFLYLIIWFLNMVLLSMVVDLLHLMALLVKYVCSI